MMLNIHLGPFYPTPHSPHIHSTFDMFYDI
jgi:hypothetical protein